MKRKPHIQKHYYIGDRRIREAAESAWRVLNPYHILTPTDMKDMKWVPLGLTVTDSDVRAICAIFDYPIELLGAEHAVTYTPHSRLEDLKPIAEDLFWPVCDVKNLPFDNLGI